MSIGSFQGRGEILKRKSGAVGYAKILIDSSKGDLSAWRLMIHIRKTKQRISRGYRQAPTKSGRYEAETQSQPSEFSGGLRYVTRLSRLIGDTEKT